MTWLIDWLGCDGLDRRKDIPISGGEREERGEEVRRSRLERSTLVFIISLPF
jgi:hypothetical protein